MPARKFGHRQGSSVTASAVACCRTGGGWRESSGRQQTRDAEWLCPRCRVCSRIRWPSVHDCWVRCGTWRRWQHNYPPGNRARHRRGIGAPLTLALSVPRCSCHQVAPRTRRASLLRSSALRQSSPTLPSGSASVCSSSRTARRSRPSSRTTVASTSSTRTTRWANIVFTPKFIPSPLPRCGMPVLFSPLV